MICDTITEPSKEVLKLPPVATAKFCQTALEAPPPNTNTFIFLSIQSCVKSAILASSTALYISSSPPGKLSVNIKTYLALLVLNEFTKSLFITEI